MASAAQDADADAAPKAVVKNVDMEEEMQQCIVELCAAAMVKFAVEKDMAAFVKRGLDEKYAPTWHVIIGKSFGSYVTHESKYFIYFYMGEIAFLIWRA
ncbi:Dyn2p [Malassezia vespertilionis]|uniref:Dynein light chain n=1 Tax=Malassezia vespertilionis TaxID=2020962 RepID=A0A2N1JBI4_9BASI|nr:Dyn2p [Malassezia vespertilionis]